MLPWAATASPPSTAAAVSFAPPLRVAAPRPPPPLCRPLPRLLCAGLNPLPRAAASDGDVFWEEPDDGSGSDYEDDGPEQRRASRFPSSSPSSRLEAARQQEQDLRREIELLLTPEEKAILDQHETPDVTRISSPKWHPLHSYALALQIPLMGKLLDSGVDINLLDQDGATPLHYAVQAGALQTVKLLIKYKVDVNVADNDGWTPLHLAIQSRNRDIAKVLLVNGVDKTRRTKDGRTALDLSLCFGRDFKSYDLAKLVKLIPASRGV